MAIAFDTASSGIVNPGTSLTYSHTCSGTNRFLLVFAFGDTASNVITGATYAGVSMTQVSAPFQISGDRWVYCWYLANPASGANNVVISASSSIVIGAESNSYTGVDQNNPIDVFTSGQNAGQTSFSLSVVTTLDNCWTIFMTRTDGTNNTPGAGTTERGDSVHGYAAFDSGGPITPPQSNTLSTSSSNPSPYGGWLVAITPPRSFTPKVIFF